MSNGNTPRDDAELENFIRRQSPLAAAYDALEPVQPPEVIDAKILAIARGAAGPATAPAAPVAKPAPDSRTAAAAKQTATRPPVGVADDDDDDEDDEAPVARRPRWLVPAALAASVLAAVGLGIALLGNETSDPGSFATSAAGSLFAKRARERSEAKEAAAEAAAAAAAREAELERAPLPPPPVFEPEGPQVQDLDKAIALIRKELVLANQMAAIAEEAKSDEQQPQLNSRQAPAPTGAAGQVADAAPPSAPAATPADAAGVVQPRDRRLGKILELYDGGNPDLAAASLEIFLRDFEDDPISRRIIEAQPKATDVAIE
jgi:hypothetical protein